MSDRTTILDPKPPFIPEKRIERAAWELLDSYSGKFETEIAAPVPIERIAELHLQLALEFKDMKRLFPFADVHGAIWFEDKIIGIDQSLNPDENPEKLGRYHFTLAHEVGHWCLHRDLFKQNPEQSSLFGHAARGADVVCRSTERKKPIEWQADAFAANLLMPRSLVQDAWTVLRNGDDREAEMVELRQQYQGRVLVYRGDYFDSGKNWDLAIKEEFAAPLAEQFSVSREAMRIRLEQLKLLVEVRSPRLF